MPESKISYLNPSKPRQIPRHKTKRSGAPYPKRIARETNVKSSSSCQLKSKEHASIF